MRFLYAGLAAIALAGMQSAVNSRPVEQHDMALVGYDDLQGRSAYQPLVHKQGARWIAYVGHHGGKVMNPITGKSEDNGTSILDVTNPKQPKYLAHIPGEQGLAEAGGAQMVRVCDGSQLPRADKSKVYLLRTYGGSAHEVWDVTDPAKPSRVSVVVSRLRDTHKSWWECDTGIAYLVSGPPDWRVRRMTQVYDLGDPSEPRFIRNFGLPGQQPGSTGSAPTELHGMISLGPKSNRIYFGYGTGASGVVQIVDRDKLLKGAKEPTNANLVYPEVARLDLPPDMGAHTTLPLFAMQLGEFGKQKLRSGSAAAAGIDHDHGDAAPERTQSGRAFIADH